MIRTAQISCFVLILILSIVSLNGQDTIKAKNLGYSQKLLDKAQRDSLYKICSDCEPPKSLLQTKYFQQYGIYDVRLEDSTIIYNVSSVERVLKDTNGLQLQEYLRIKTLSKDSCRSSLYQVDDVRDFYWGGLGSNGQPVSIPINPARFFQKKQDKIKPPMHHLYFGPLAGFAGSYENPNNRDVGIDNAYFGGHLKYLYGADMRYGVSAEVLMENSRLRLPVGLEAKMYLLGGQEAVQKEDSFYPSPCQFGEDGDSEISPNDSIKDIKKLFTHQKRNFLIHDKTVYFTQEEYIKTDPFRLAAYAEGGVVLDLFSEDDGAGANPSLNPEDWRQYYFGAGLTLEILEDFDISLGARYMRLNLRTPCEECDNLFVVNTNESISILLKLSYVLH